MKLDTINTITTGTNQNPMEEVFVFMLSSAKIKTGKFEFIKPYLGTTGVGMLSLIHISFSWLSK